MSACLLAPVETPSPYAPLANGAREFFKGIFSYTNTVHTDQDDE